MTRINETDPLRVRAEHLLSDDPPIVNADDAVEMAELIHELQVHQTELTLQNETLRALRDELEAARDRYEDLYEEAPVAYLTLDPSGVVRQCNRAASRLLGRETTALMGAPFGDFISRGHRVRFRNHLEHVAREGSGVVHLNGRSDAGDRTILQVETTRIQGQPSAFRTILVDFTERWQLEQERQQQAENLRAILDTATDGIIATDARGIIATFNRAAENLFGYAANEVVGHNVAMLMDTPDRDGHDQYIANYERTRVARIIGIGREVRGRRKDGTVFPLRLSIGEMVCDGPVKYTAVLHDLSHENRLELRARQAEKMEAVGRLASGIAHDLGNLLAGIIGVCDVLSSTLEDGDPKKHPLDMMRASADRGSKTVRQLLGVASRPEGRTLVDVDQMLVELSHMLTHLLGGQIGLKLVRGSNVGAVKADRAQLEQILLNLVTNARDAIDGAGTVTIRSARLFLARGSPELPAHLAPGTWVKLSVTDSGHGMDDATRARVFEPFFTTKAADKGTGLGLANAYGLVQQYGGVIEVDSAPGQGTTFQILLPAADGADGTDTDTDTDTTAAATPTSQPVPTRARPGTVLVVDDDELIRLSMSAWLRDAGLQVVSAPDGSQALAHPDLAGVDVVVTDVRLPQMTGPALARALHLARPELPVLFVSAHPAAVLERDGLIEPGTRVIQKPCLREDLVVQVNQALDAAADPALA